MKIKNIIFDFGGVLYNIDYNATSKCLAKYSSDINFNISLDEMLDLPESYEKGMVSDEIFKNELISKFNLNCNEKDIEECWNAMLIGLKNESIEFIKSIKTIYNIALFSNTNKIHYKKFYSETKELLDNFDYVYFSFKIGLRKPEKESYLYVCQNSNFKIEQTVFIDDNLINIKGAQSVGLKTIHFKTEDNLSSIFDTINKITQV